MVVLIPGFSIVLLILTAFEAFASSIPTALDYTEVESSGDDGETCPGELCNEMISVDCLEHQIYASESNRCLSLVGEICEDHNDCIPNASCTRGMSTTLGRFVKKCTCLHNFFKSADGNCNAYSKYGKFCDSSQPCEANTPFMTCVENKCTCSNEASQVYDPIKNACVLRVGEDCNRHSSWHRSICMTNAQCQTYGSGTIAKKCQCIRGYVLRPRTPSDSDSKTETCAASYGHSCNKTIICDNGLVCTDGKCLCDSPLHQIFDSGRCRRTVGAQCDQQSPCVSNALCVHDDQPRCECNEGYGSTFSEPKVCKLGYGNPCSSGSAYQFQCNHDRGLVCRSGTCSCYDPALVYQNSSGSCTNEVGQVCGVLPIRARPMELLGLIGRREHSILNQNAVTIACRQDLVCGRVQGQESCSCLDIDTIQSDRAFKIEYCLAVSY